MFVPGKLFQHGLMFAGKAGAYPRVDHLKKALHLGEIRPYPKNIGLCWKGLPGKTL